MTLDLIGLMKLNHSSLQQAYDSLGADALHAYERQMQARMDRLAASVRKPQSTLTFGEAVEQLQANAAAKQTAPAEFKADEIDPALLSKRLSDW